jgi:hypothetical protein
MSCKTCQYIQTGFSPLLLRCGHPQTQGHDLPVGLAVPRWCPIVHTLPSDDPVGGRIKALEDRLAAAEARLESLDAFGDKT